jgi:hypothetical protein
MIRNLSWRCTKKEERRKEIIAMAAMQIMQLRKGNE